MRGVTLLLFLLFIFYNQGYNNMLRMLKYHMSASTQNSICRKRFTISLIYRIVLTNLDAESGP